MNTPKNKHYEAIERIMRELLYMAIAKIIIIFSIILIPFYLIFYDN